MNAPFALVAVDFACNDPDSGLFAGRAPQINIKIGDCDYIEFEADDWRGSKLSFVKGKARIRFAGHQWPVHGSQDWVGNWCWNRYWLDSKDASAFVHWLRAGHRYKCTSAECSFYDWFNENKPENPVRIQRYLEGKDNALSAWFAPNPTSHPPSGDHRSGESGVGL